MNSWFINSDWFPFISIFYSKLFERTFVLILFTYFGVTNLFSRIGAFFYRSIASETSWKNCCILYSLLIGWFFQFVLSVGLCMFLWYFHYFFMYQLHLTLYLLQCSVHDLMLLLIFVFPSSSSSTSLPLIFLMGVSLRRFLGSSDHWRIFSPWWISIGMPGAQDIVINCLEDFATSFSSGLAHVSEWKE